MRERRAIEPGDYPLIDKLRNVLHDSAYPGSGVREVLGAELGSAHHRMDLPLYLRRLAAPTRLNTLVKLFALASETTEKEAAAALEPLGLEGAAALGLIDHQGGTVRPRVGISVCDGLFLAHDCHNEDPAKLSSDYVLGVNPAALMLANLTVRRRVQNTLDLGTGCGIQALLAARHSEKVVGIDTNARALTFARFNARLNGFTNVEFRQGSLFDPVLSERFDLIVCNPPYVISPESKYMFRDSGFPGDTISETVVRRAHEHLNEGGFACILCNWALPTRANWVEPLQRWVQGSQCDAWLLHTSSQDPLTYAAIWTRSRDARAYGEALDEWVSYFSENRTQAIGLGAVILRRRSGPANWVRPDDLPAAPVESCSELILSVFESEDYLATLDGEEGLLNERFRWACDHRLRQTLVPQNSGYGVEQIELQWQRGFRLQGAIDPRTLQFLTHCDGRRTLGEIIEECGLGEPQDMKELLPAIAPIVRRLLALGLLAPAPRDNSASASEQPGGCSELPN